MTNPPVTPRRAQTQQKLLEAASRMFAERGVPAASVEEICEAAGFTRGAFYSNFSSKDDLCIALLRDLCERDLYAARSAIPDADPSMAGQSLDELVHQAIHAFVSFQRTDDEWVLVNAELRLHAVRTPAIRAAYAQFLADSAYPVASLVEEALGRIGHRLTLPPGQAMGLLRAVWLENQMVSLLDRENGIDATSLEANLGVLLRAMTEPI